MPALKPIVIQPDDPMYGPLRFQLATKLSDVVLLALEDLERAEASKLYRIDMDATYHTPRDDMYGDDDAEPDKCTVCFAGSIIAFSLKAKINEEKEPSDYGDEAARKLWSIDTLREGCVVDALKAFIGDDGDGESLMTSAQRDAAQWVDDHSNLCGCMSSYSGYPDEFKNEMEVLVALMRYKGL